MDATLLTADATDARVLKAIRRVLGHPAALDVPMDTELKSLGLDSMRIIDLLLEVETEFGVTFTDDLLTPETFRTPSTLRAAVVSLQGGG